MDAITYIRLSINTHVASGASRKFFNKKLDALGPTPSIDSLLQLMAEIKGNSPAAFSRAREFSPADPEILTFFVPAGSASIDRTKINDPTLDKYTTRNTISIVALAEAVGNIANTFNVSPGTLPQPEPIPNTFTQVMGNMANVRLAGNIPTIVQSVAGLLGTTKISNDPYVTFSSIIGDMSLVNFGGDSVPPSSISAAIGTSKIGATQTLTGAIGDLDRIILNGTNNQGTSLSATIGQDVALDEDIPDRRSLIQGLNTVHSHKPTMLYSFCSAQGDTIGTPIPSPTSVKTAQQPYTADIVGLLRLPQITNSGFTGTDQFFTCLHLVRKIAKGKPGSHTVQNSGVDYTNKANCKSTIEPVIVGYATGTNFNNGITSDNEVKEEIIGELCAQYPN